MRSTMLSVIALASLLVPVLDDVPASAASSKTWVSHSGIDANPCISPTAPCATFHGALGKTSPGGEIGVVDAGDYGEVSIGQSVSITNDGAGEASILVPGGGDGIVIQAGNGDVVGLRGLVIDGQGGGAIGILINSASAVHIQNCVIRSFEFAGSGFGILLLDGKAQLFASDTIIFNNGSSAATGGISIRPFSQGTRANVVLDRVHLENNVVGLLVNGSANASVGPHVVLRDSVVSGNASDGIRAFTIAGESPAFIVVEHSSVSNNVGNGILADGPHATVLLNDNTITRNGTGIGTANSGQLISYGNNKNNNNIGPEGAPTGLYSQM